MMKVTLEMAPVSTCNVAQCAYNVDRGCHAKAITIGDAETPACDTYFRARRHSHDDRRVAGVGACKVTSCVHNVDYECGASGIEVGTSGDQTSCMTYKARAN